MSSDQFLIPFLAMMIAVISASAVGNVMGIGIRALFARRVRFTSLAIYTLRIALWMPLFASWAFRASWLPTLFTAILVGCYYYLAGIKWPKAIKITFLYTFLVSLVSQVWIGPSYGWYWFREETLGYSALVFIALLVVIELAFSFDFDQTAKELGNILLKELDSVRNLTRGTMVIGVAVLILSLLKIGFIWEDITASLLEILGGLALSALLGVMVEQALSANALLRRWILPLLPLARIPPIVLPLVFLYGSVLTLSWQTAVGVAALSFFPFTQALWGLRGHPLRFRLLVAFDEALPFAFLAMFFGETMNAIAGLGFQAVMARTTAEAASIILVPLGFFLLLTSVLTAAARQQHAFPKNLS